jgi:hypothetical protein
MVPIYSDKRSLLIYYGHDNLEDLLGYRRVVLQSAYYSPEQLATLRAAGTQTLAYLSLGEDTGPAALWQRPEKNQNWGGHYVNVAHPDWRRHVLQKATSCLTQGFDGFFLDTLDTVDLFPEDRLPMLNLIAKLRELYPRAVLLANRGFSLLPKLTTVVDGLVFEAFSSTWQTSAGDYRALDPAALFYNAKLVSKLRQTGIALYALDYAESAGLIKFARERAGSHGLISLISNRELTRL